MDFDMNTTWSRATTLVAENFQLLGIIAGVFLLVPAVIVALALPDFASLVDPTAPPEAMFAQLSEYAGPIIFWMLFGTLLQFIGHGAMVALMGQSRPTVGEALGSGLKALLPIVGVMILFLLTYFVAAFIVLLVLGLIAQFTGSLALASIGPLLIIPIAIYFAARLSMAMPIVVFDKVANPVSAATRSWTLTKPHKWSVFFFWFALFVAYAVVLILATGIIGVVAALASGAVGGLLIMGVFNGLLGMAIGMLASGIAVSMFSQLAGPSTEDVTETFE